MGLTILDLPIELLELLSKFLNKIDIVNLYSTCKILNDEKKNLEIYKPFDISVIDHLVKSKINLSNNSQKTIISNKSAIKIKIQQQKLYFNNNYITTVQKEIFDNKSIFVVTLKDNVLLFIGHAVQPIVDDKFNSRTLLNSITILNDEIFLISDNVVIQVFKRDKIYLSVNVEYFYSKNYLTVSNYKFYQGGYLIVQSENQFKLYDVADLLNRDDESQDDQSQNDQSQDDDSQNNEKCARSFIYRNIIFYCEKFRKYPNDDLFFIGFKLSLINQIERWKFMDFMSLDISNKYFSIANLFDHKLNFENADQEELLQYIHYLGI